VSGLFPVEQSSQLFTMHGAIMLLVYATPVVFGFANYSRNSRLSVRQWIGRLPRAKPNQRRGFS